MSGMMFCGLARFLLRLVWGLGEFKWGVRSVICCLSVGFLVGEEANRDPIL
jgi:hypothetical protein